MKKIFTLLFAVGMFTLAQAQPGTRDNRQNDQREVIKVVVNDNDRYDNDRFDNDDRYGNSSFGKERRMRMQLAGINREFDYKIQRVRNSFFLNRWEKQRQIRFLEAQRQHEIRKVYAEFSKKRNRHHDRDDRSGRRY
jgi:hypothetical protein